jgi:hypothetical protein
VESPIHVLGALEEAAKLHPSQAPASGVRPRNGTPLWASARECSLRSD